MKELNYNNILLKRFLLSLAILVFVRLGTFLPVPGIDHGYLAFYIQRHSLTRSLVSTFSGNDTFVIGLFTLNIFPYINASILIQLKKKEVVNPLLNTNIYILGDNICKIRFLNFIIK